MAECWICLDKGIVKWTEDRNGVKYEYHGRCTCLKGNQFKGMILAESILSPFEISDISRENKRRSDDLAPSIANK